MPEYQSFIEIAAEVLQTEPKYLTPNVQLVKDLGADALDLERIMLKAMELFDVEVSEEDVSGVETVGDAFHLFHPAV